MTGTCDRCRLGPLVADRRDKTAEDRGRVATVTGVPVMVCSFCGALWYAENVAVTLDAMLTDLLARGKTSRILAWPETAPPPPDPLRGDV